jgi:hypothetical protein
MRSLSLILSLVLLGCLPTVLDGFQVPQQLIKSQPCTSLIATSRSGMKAVDAVLPKVTHSALFSAPDDGLSPQKNPGKKLVLAVRRLLARVVAFPAKTSSRFSKLSRKAKTIVVMQTLIFTMILGSFGRKVYVRQQYSSSGGPPIELAYSSFMDLVDQSGKDVLVDNVRIGRDKIVYRVTKEATSDSDAKKVVAYTNQVAASPELIDHLRTNDIPFAAAPQKRANTFAVVARTAILGFYVLILFRMYKTFSGNASGGGAGDVPGKLADTSSSLPLASFNDIQGIDVAKNEVMELVDTLRNPEKYAILGARAPTGLLLEGPPGTGKVR